MCIQDFICTYRPTLGHARHSIHIKYPSSSHHTHPHTYSNSNLRSTIPGNTQPFNFAEHIPDDKYDIYLSAYLLTSSDKTLIDNTNKLYHTLNIHGYIIHYEPDIFTNIHQLKTALEIDLKAVNNLLPNEARRKLQCNTSIWVNTSITYGHNSDPIVGRCATFHPGPEWLRKNG